MDRQLTQLHVQNFRSLRDVTIPLGPVNVLAGPNGSGKTNVLDVFRFLAEMYRSNPADRMELGDLMKSVFGKHGGYWNVASWGDETRPKIQVGLEGIWTRYSSHNTPDRYKLEFNPVTNLVVYRSSLEFKRIGGPGRPITLNFQSSWFESGKDVGCPLDTVTEEAGEALRSRDEPAAVDGQAEAEEFTDELASLRDVPADADLANDAHAALLARRADGSHWQPLVEDARRLLPQLENIEVENSPHSHEDRVVLHERGLRRPTPLADASAGTIRLLGLLALLYDPEPPALTSIDGIERGIHPQALELLVERIREASERTQFLITTHSHALVDWLRPEELIVCERRDDGSSAIPALSTNRIKKIQKEWEGLPLGRLWFSGALGGDLNRDTARGPRVAAQPR
ncbi:MAG TPA: AAA family ATPase [Mycobacteriales bacterium]|nr:AAA family ATPase [Mycobacteriales bacterium]